MSIRSLEVARTVTGYHQVTSLGSAVICPGTGAIVTLQAQGQALRYRPDGVDPTANVGVLLAVGDTHTLNMGDGKIQNIRVIETQNGGVLNVIAYR